MPSISADGWVLLIREAVAFLVPLAIVLLGLYAAVRFGVKHGMRDSRRESRTGNAGRTAAEALELPDPRM
ncbi:hypothetical protein [Quadrisphaera setariae]|uniref:Uncharacterized protein n=1 Tax=Quadrisphaera setariae TaxID=2593304 RepID=A0A5C8ZK72_9ACTN|nr:hypothetical protein [Quadrisphaera setariae]TXR57578.1 hypothetical protein FMM08_05000 [Quadrisphaera setariae]